MGVKRAQVKQQIVSNDSGFHREIESNSMEGRQLPSYCVA